MTIDLGSCGTGTVERDGQVRLTSRLILPGNGNRRKPRLPSSQRHRWRRRFSSKWTRKSRLASGEGSAVQTATSVQSSVIGIPGTILDTVRVAVA
jgi:hypothetical protein